MDIDHEKRHYGGMVNGREGRWKVSSEARMGPWKTEPILNSVGHLHEFVVVQPGISFRL